MFKVRKLGDLYSGGGDSTKYGFAIAPTRYAAMTCISGRRPYGNRFSDYPIHC